MESCYGFRTERTSRWYKYQQMVTWQTSVQSHLEDRESQILEEPFWLVESMREGCLKRRIVFKIFRNSDFQNLPTIWSSTRRFCSYRSLYDRLLRGANQEEWKANWAGQQVNDRAERTSDEQCYHVEKRYWTSWEYTQSRTDEIERPPTELAGMIRLDEDDRHGIELLRDHARRVHSGLVLNAGFVQKHQIHKLLVCMPCWVRWTQHTS